MKPVEHAAPREAYDRWSAVYDGEDNPLVALDERFVPPLIGDVRGREALELACGTGRHTARLVAAGARVTAVDFSRGMLDKARQRLASSDVRFEVGDITEPLAFDAARFDFVLCCLAMEHVRDLPPLFAEVARVLRPQGRFVCSDMHPAMRLRGVQANFDDPTSATEVRVEGYEHPVADYVMAALDAGFSIERVEEHKADDALARVMPRAAKYLGWPMLVVLALRAPALVR
jgi:ubiquinone/menaquinone biosynthesis C-methylase UbiE